MIMKRIIPASVLRLASYAPSLFALIRARSHKASRNGNLISFAVGDQASGAKCRHN